MSRKQLVKTGCFLLTNGEKKRYIYDNDRLTSFDKKTCKYDELGNPTTYLDKKLEWEFRNLKLYDGIEFEYNASGMRTSRKQGESETKFYYAGTKLLGEKRVVKVSDLELVKNGEPNYLYHNPDDDEKLNAYTTTSSVNIEYLYGADGVTGFVTHRAGEPTKTYYYRKNLQGDVTHIFEEVGGKKLLKAKYVYDAWGNHTIVRDDAGIGTLNSFRYRGYYYDSTIGLYYLQSRYYDPETGRFINADDISILNESKSMINGLNLYAYCGNNPVMRTDPTGRAWWHWLVGGLIIVAAVALTVVTAGGFAAAGGAILGAIGIGSAATGAAGFFAAVTVGAVVAGGIGLLSGGIMSSMQGGNFWDGASEGFMWGAIGGALGGGFGTMFKGVGTLYSIGGKAVGSIPQIIGQGTISLGMYFAQTYANGKNPTLLGALTSFAGGGVGGAIAHSIFSTQLTVNVLVEGLKVSLEALKITFGNLFGLDPKRQNWFW